MHYWDGTYTNIRSVNVRDVKNTEESHSVVDLECSDESEYHYNNENSEDRERRADLEYKDKFRRVRTY